MLYFSENDIRSRVTMSDVIEAVKKAFSMAEKGEIIEPEPMPEPTETNYIIENFVQTSVMVKS